jgi:predicted LPLAT superfamily acyltransferase
MIDELISQARRLAQSSRARPKQADLKRAVSAAYYAVFHAFAKNCADCMVGTVKKTRPNKAWVQVYRSLDHKFAKAACAKVRGMPFPNELKECADTFIDLQAQRHLADYDPSHRLGRSSALEAVAKAEDAVKKLRDASPKDRRAIAVQVLVKQR